MALTAAERAKRYREKIKQNPDQYEAHKKKELLRLKKAQKKINDLNEEEKNEMRKKWREQKRRKKEKQEACQSKSNPKPQEACPDLNLVQKVKYRNLRRNYKSAIYKVHKYKQTLINLKKKIYRVRKKHEEEIMSLKAEKEKLLARHELLELSLRGVYSDKKPTKKPDRNHWTTHRTINKSKRKFTNEKILSEMEEFYNRDDISRSTAGKKETRTRNKKKMQIRYLVDTLKNIYQIYRDEGGRYGFTTFFRYKPFYVLSPSSMSRDTCMCIKHSNIEFMFNALKLKGVISYAKLSELLKNVVCDEKSLNCMYSKCNQCESTRIQYSEDKLQDEITWYKWVRVDHKYKKSGREHITKKTVKQQMKGTVCELIAEFEKQFKHFKTHVFNWREQHRQYRACVTNLTNKEIVILCDFSENFDCKYRNEIQSMHFGASKNSITLHTGVLFGKDFSQSFVSVCDDNCHEPNAIWAHLLPVINHAKTITDITVIHFFSDGPSSQYRQKKNFYLLNLFVQKLKLSYATWSFSEAGHGKSLADGIGGSAKRQLDRRVFYGEDVTNASDAQQILEKTMKSVKSFFIPSEDIKNFKKLIPENIRVVPGTMKLHQVISTTPNQIKYRQLSCFCGDTRGLCNCLDSRTHRLLSDNMNLCTNSLLGKSRTSPSEEPLGLLDAADTDTDSVLGQPLAFSCSEFLESLVPASTKTIDNSDFLLEQIDISLRKSAIATEIEHNKIFDLLVSSDDVTIPSLLENQQSFDCFMPIEDIVSKPSATYFQAEPSTKSQLQIASDANKTPEVSPPVKRAKTIKPFDVSPPLQVSSPVNRVKILKPSDPFPPPDFALPAKKTKILQRNRVKDENRMPSKTAVRLSSSRTFPCHLCKTRQPFMLHRMVQCMICKKWVCFSCSGTTYFDYICTICYEQ